MKIVMASVEFLGYHKTSAEEASTIRKYGFKVGGVGDYKTSAMKGSAWHTGGNYFTSIMTSGPGIWFADSPKHTNNGKLLTTDSTIIAAYLTFDRPLVITSHEKRIELRDSLKPHDINAVTTQNALPLSKLSPKLQDKYKILYDFPYRFDQKQRDTLVRAGYDGIILNINGEPREYIVFEPNQIRIKE